MKVFSWSVLSKLCLNVSISFLGGFFFYCHGRADYLPAAVKQNENSDSILPLIKKDGAGQLEDRFLQPVCARLTLYQAVLQSRTVC